VPEYGKNPRAHQMTNGKN